MNRTMARKTALAALVGGLVIGGTASAGTCGTNYCTATVLQLRIQENLVYVQLNVTTANFTSLTNCTPYQDVFFTLPADFGTFKEAMAALLAAKHAGTEVTIRTVDGTANCEVSYMRSH